MNDSRSALTERIAFAEEWLDRAKRQLADGNVAHGSLHLMLAEAELQRAREVTGAPMAPATPPRRGSRFTAGARAIGGIATVAGLVAAIVWQVPVMHHSVGGSDSAWPVVTFSAQTGDMLRLVSGPDAASQPVVVERTVERTIVKPIIVRVSVTAPARVAPAAASPSAATVAAPRNTTHGPNPRLDTPAQSEQASAAQPKTVEAPPAAPVISDADVIDLVLAAERSLRQPAKH